MLSHDEPFDEEEVEYEEDDMDLQGHENSLLDAPIDYAHCIAMPIVSFSGADSIAALLLSWTEQFADYKIIRTEDPEVYAECGVRLSVGDVYDHDGLSYICQTNMNLRGFPPTISVAGLIFYHYGQEALTSRLASIPEEDHEFVMRMIYSTVIEDLDSGNECDIRRLAQTLDPTDDPDPYVKQAMFQQLMELVCEQIDQKLAWMSAKMIPARRLIRQAMQDKTKILPTGEILLIPRYVPLEMHKDLIDGSDDGRKNNIKYVVMPRLVDDWGVYALKWRSTYKKLKFAGARDERLNSNLQGINGHGWIHVNGLVGAWKTQQCAIDYLKQTVRQPEKSTGLPPL